MAKQSNFNCTIVPFDGDPDLCTFFFEQIETLQQLNKWSDEQTILFTKTKLQSSALKFYITSSSASKATNIAALREIFLKFFRPMSIQTARTSLSNLKLLPDESFINFAHRLSNMISLAHPEITDEVAINSISLSTFMKSIPNDIKIKLLEMDIPDYQSTVAKAQQLLDITGHHSTAEPNLSDLYDQINALKCELKEAKSMNHSSTRSNNHDASTSKITNHTKSRIYPYSKSFNNCKYNTRIMCQYCGLRNHLMKDCYKFKNAMFRGRDNSNNQRGNRNSFRGNRPYNNNTKLNPNAQSFQLNNQPNQNQSNSLN